MVHSRLYIGKNCDGTPFEKISKKESTVSLFFLFQADNSIFSVNCTFGKLHLYFII